MLIKENLAILQFLDETFLRHFAFVFARHAIVVGHFFHCSVLHFSWVLSQVYILPVLICGGRKENIFLLPFSQAIIYSLSHENQNTASEQRAQASSVTSQQTTYEATGIYYTHYHINCLVQVSGLFSGLFSGSTEAGSCFIKTL